MKYAVLISLLVSATAYATTADCGGAADGTPCTASCIVFGQCQAGKCAVQNLPGTPTPGYAVDGTSCSSGNRCTASDACVAGQCVPGGSVTCTPPDSCHTASCDPAIGCVYVISCLPDMAKPVDLFTPDTSPPVDMSSTDMAPPIDLARPDLKTLASSPPDFSGAPAPDMARQSHPDLAQAADLARVDLARPNDFASRPLDGGITIYPHVRGDAVVGGCSLVAPTTPNWLPLMFVFFCAVLFRVRVLRRQKQ